MTAPRTDKYGHQWPVLDKADLKPDGSVDASCLLCGASISATPNHVGVDGFVRKQVHNIDPAARQPCKGLPDGA